MTNIYLKQVLQYNAKSSIQNKQLSNTIIDGTTKNDPFTTIQYFSTDCPMKT